MPWNLSEFSGPSGTYEKRRIALRQEYSAVVAGSKKLTAITTGEEAEEATKFGRLLQTAAKETEAFFKTVKSQIDDIKKPVLQAEKDDTGPYNTEKARLGSLLTVYQAEERRKRDEAERVAWKEAQKAAEEEAIQRALDLAAAGEDEAANSSFGGARGSGSGGDPGDGAQADGECGEEELHGEGDGPEGIGGGSGGGQGSAHGDRAQ